MRFERPVLLIFHGATGDGPAERFMAAARVAAARVSAHAALASGFEAVIIATDDPAALDPVSDGVLIDPDPPAGDGAAGFSFEARLRSLVERFELARPAVMSSGAVPLVGEAEFRLMVEQLDARDARFVTNNFFSGDLTGWTPGSAIARVHDLPRDNLLPRRLRDEAGLAPVILPRTTATQFDLDTPADLAILALADGLPAPLAAATEPARALAERFRALMPLLCDGSAEVFVAGRVNSATWAHLERETACRIRLVSEERGLAAAGPDHRPRSVLGFLLEELGEERFFRRLAELGQAAVIDTRVLEAHLGLAPSREDRFQSDLFAPDRIADPWLRRFTAAAAAAPIPVLLGGHSLVSAGLMALNDVAWREHDRQLPGLSR